MKRRGLLAAALAAGAAMLVALPAQAAEGEHQHGDVTVTFFHSPNATAGWAHFKPAPAGDGDTWSIRLALNGANTYAGAVLHGVAGQPPAVPPAFDFRTTLTGDSKGSPRLVMIFSDGGRLELRPLVWVANTWVHEDGATHDWDNNGGACGFKYEVTYAVAVACHPGATVTDVFVVTDSSWFYTSGYINYIDNIRYGDAFVTRPGGEVGNADEGDGENGDREAND